MRHRKLAWATLGTCCFWASLALGAKNDWAEGVAGREDGATREYYNRAGLLRWTHRMGDWRDADGTAQGSKPYCVATVKRGQVDQFVEWDVTTLVREWAQRKHPNQGMLLRLHECGGDFQFRSRENKEAAMRPQFIIRSGDKPTTYAASADTFLEGSTYRCQGQRDQLRVGSRNPTLVRFDLSRLASDASIASATLRLSLLKVYGSGAAKIGVFRCQQGHDLPASDPVLGIAARYPGDKAIAEDPAVVFAADFEADDWNQKWTRAANMNVIETVSADASRKLEPFSGKALRVKIAEGSTGALNTLFKFQQETGSEPEEIYFRYYLRLGDDWNQTLQGGKMPGISGTYGVAGWGGRKSNGKNGWSARGSFQLSIPDGNPLQGLHPLGTYCYHADMAGYYGDVWVWQNDYRGFLQKNRWYAIEQYLKLNTAGEKNGVLRAWVDGRLAFEKTDIRFRLVDKLKIEQVWMNVYHGGRKPSPYNQHLFIDNVVIARKYIGPLRPSK